jgi:predicted ATP-dependent Lon-type protease
MISRLKPDDLTYATRQQTDPELDNLLTRHFAGKVVRKDLTKLIKEGANVPVYVLEYLLGMYCASRTTPRSSAPGWRM